jgi:hypothetical protein
MTGRAKRIKYPMVIFTLLSLFAFAGSAFAQYGPYCDHFYVPLQPALDAMNSDAQVTVATRTVSGWSDPNYYYEFSPACSSATEALIIYPGACLDERAYAVVAHDIAAAGYLVAIVPMPGYIAFGGPNVRRADTVISNHPEIVTWSIGGHSLGGVGACAYAGGTYTNSNKINGIVLWASYPGSSISDKPVKVISIWGTNDGYTTSDKIDASKPLLPPDTRYVALQGANHSQFGFYGYSATDYSFVQPNPDPGDNPATITRQQQTDLIFQYTLSLLRSLTPQTHAELSRTGQTTCWDTDGNVISCAGTGQDGDIQAGVAWPDPRFTDNSDNTITDHITGLMWTKNANLPNSATDWQQALDYVAVMNSGSGTYGYKDWRLPNLIELESLQNQEPIDFVAWLTSQGFSNVQRSTYWSSTTYAIDTSSAWAFIMTDQNVFYGISKTYSEGMYMWPVRGGQCGVDMSAVCLPKTGQKTSYYTGDDGALQKGVDWPDPRFTDNGNGTVTDNLTGLMWTKDAYPAGTTKTWTQALDYVKTVNTGDYTDWRLPNRKELRSIIDYSQGNPALPPGNPFANIQFINNRINIRYWSSTSWPSTPTPTGVWMVTMMNGGNFENEKTIALQNVWPVRCGRLSTTTTIIPTTTTTVQPTTSSSTSSSMPTTTTTSVQPTTTTTAPPPTTTTTEQPTLINLSSFDAKGILRFVILTWKTESEVNNAGFNIYRAESEAGEYVKINSSLIPAKGSTTGGANYRYIDQTANRGTTYYYKLEDVDMSGNATMHGPVSANTWSLFSLF